MEIVSLIAAIFSIGAAVYTFFQSKKIKEVKDYVSSQFSKIRQQSLIPYLQEIQREISKLTVSGGTKGKNLEETKLKITSNFTKVLNELKSSNSEGIIRDIIGNAQEKMNNVIDQDAKTVNGKTAQDVNIILQNAISQINTNIFKI